MVPPMRLQSRSSASPSFDRFALSSVLLKNQLAPVAASRLRYNDAHLAAGM